MAAYNAPRLFERGVPSHDPHKPLAPLTLLRAPAFDASRVAPPHPFASLHEIHGRPLKVAILSDFVRVSYANGAALQTRLLYQELRQCGHQVTIVAAHDPDARPDELAPGTIALPSRPLRAYPGLHIPLPLESWVGDPDRWDFDIVFGQTTSFLLQLGIWLRRMKGIPLISVNTTHLNAAYEPLLPASLASNTTFKRVIETLLGEPCNRVFARTYQQGDVLMVLSEGLKTFWSQRGVDIPIHVVPRAVSNQLFDRPLGPDPYAARGVPHGMRLLCAGRLVKEKVQDRAIRIFARYVLPKHPQARLVLLGEGPDRSYFEDVAKQCGVVDQVIFTGEVPFQQMVDWYGHADLFFHTSISETYGNVLSEALWMGLPTVAFADGMGASTQVAHGVAGYLLEPGDSTEARNAGDQAFGDAVCRLIEQPELRARFGAGARRVARERGALRSVQQKTADAFRAAHAHRWASELRPAIFGSAAERQRVTRHCFQSWTVINGGLVLSGMMRPSPDRPKESMHVQFAK